MRTSRGRIDQCTAVQGRGGSTGEQDLRVQGCLRFSVNQVSCRGGKSHKEKDRGGVGGCLSLKESCGVKCAGAVSAVFRGESLLGELWGRQYSWRGRLASAEK